MAVRISIASTQCAGMTPTMQGDAYKWIVTFRLDGDQFMGTAVSFEVVGPQHPADAQERALPMLRSFAREACDAAKRFQAFASQTQHHRRNLKARARPHHRIELPRAASKAGLSPDNTRSR
jgi:hypothetical protein